MAVTDCNHAKRKAGNFQQKKFKKQCIYPPNYVLCSLSAPFLSPNARTPCQESVITPGKLYTVGRSKSICDIIFEDSRVSRQHCQLYLDSEQNKLFLLDGTILPSERNKYAQIFQGAVKKNMPFSVNKNDRCEIPEISLIKYVKPSLNGIFVNGNLVKIGHFRVLSVGDEVSLVCHHAMDPTFQPTVGFVVKVNYNDSPVTGGDASDNKINVHSPCQATYSGTRLSCDLDCAKESVYPKTVDALKDSGMWGNVNRTDTLNMNIPETLKECFTNTGVSKPRKEVELSRTLTGNLLEASQKLRHSLLCNQENWQINSCHENFPPVCSGHLNLMNKQHSQNFESREEKMGLSTQLDIPKLKTMELSCRLDFQINLTKYTTEEKHNVMAYATDGKSEEDYHDILKEAQYGLYSDADIKKGETTGSFVKQIQEPSITTHSKLGSGALSIPNKNPLLVNTSLHTLIKGKDSDNGVDPNYYSFNDSDKRVEQLISRASSLLRKCRNILRNDSVFDLKISSENPRHYLVDPSKNTQVCPGKNTDTSQDISRNSDGILCRSNMGNSKQYTDSAHISILKSDARNKKSLNETKSTNNELNSIMKASITEKHLDGWKVDESADEKVVSLAKIDNETISKKIGIHPSSCFECNDSESSNKNGRVPISENKDGVVLGKDWQRILAAEPDIEVSRVKKDNSSITWSPKDVTNMIGSQRVVHEKQVTQISYQHQENISLAGFSERENMYEVEEQSHVCRKNMYEVGEQSDVCHYYEKPVETIGRWVNIDKECTQRYSERNEEQKGTIGRWVNIDKECTQRYSERNEEQKGSIFILDKLEKNSSTYSGKIFSETDPKNIDKPITENLCKEVTPGRADQSKQLKLSRSNSNLIKAEQQCSCSNENGQDALNLRKLQEEISELHIVNRLCSEAVPCPLNEVCKEYHEDVAVIFTNETQLAKQATSGEVKISHGVYPSKGEMGKLTDQETDVKDIHALDKETCADVSEDQISSIVGERGKISSIDLQPGKAEWTKNSSVNDVSLLSRKGKVFSLNQLDAMELNSGKNAGTVSLKDLLTPVDNLLGIFCATFTADISWFLSSCKVPKHLPVTIACHNSERCWSRCNDQRWSRPYTDWPNLTVVYPPFPDTIAFAKGKRQGVGCHHPKIFLLHRRDIMRVIITSANLGPNQWLNVTNTVWWQDFPRRSTQDYLSLFCPSVPGSKHIVNGDFAAQLAGFLATLIVGVPAEARWIAELAYYDFRKAAGYLVASVPGMHGCPNPYPQLPAKFQTCISKSSNWRSSSAQYLGIVPTSVVGLSYRFCSAADPKGARLKALARLLSGLRGDMEGLIPVLLKRTHNVSADPNAVSVIVYDINSSCEDLFLEEEFLDAGYVHLGFLQMDVAEWIADLWDAGIFSFAACICPQEALATASGRSNNKVQLILYVFQGQNFAQLSATSMSYEHGVSICSLLRSLQRPFGLWRLQEVLSQYRWPDSLETDFIYGSSSIGMSLDAHFLAAFSAAAGKRSIPSAASDESDPEWGCWDAQHESESPSIGIVFPTIQRVQYGKKGIHAYSRLLCFTESTWERLKSANLLHDAIPYPRERVGFPMHVKVARRRFQYFSNAPSFGWIYCGSHNFSPAAWGRPLFKSSESKAATSAGSVLGSTLRICNYEIGLVFIVPPPEDLSCTTKKHGDLDRFILPFVVPAPKYQESDRPATTKAMREARIEMLKLEQLQETRAVECLDLEEVPDEEEVPNEDAGKEISDDGGQQEGEEEKAYAETLWSQFDSCHS